MTDIVFDNIIFTLQKAGGISGVWKELLERTLSNGNYVCEFLEYTNARENLFRKELNIENSSILNLGKKDKPMERYLNPFLSKKKDFIFHSSYYRICTNKHAMNVTTVHDFVYELYRTGLPKHIHHQQKKRAVLASEAIICVSENTRKDFLNFFPQVGEDRVFVIHNGVSESFRQLDQTEVPAFLKPYGNYVIYIGIRTDPHKNIHSLIRALEKQPDLNLILIGGGKLDESEVLLYDKSIKGRYFQLNNVSNEHLNMIYNSAVALVYPSVYEGFGIPVLEAQRAGCPVIATNRSSISEVAGDGAWLTQAGLEEEIILGLDELRGGLFRKQLIEKGIINSKRFSWSRMATETLQVYEAILSSTFQ